MYETDEVISWTPCCMQMTLNDILHLNPDYPDSPDWGPDNWGSTVHATASFQGVLTLKDHKISKFTILSI